MHHCALLKMNYVWWWAETSHDLKPRKCKSGADSFKCWSWLW